jgi:hypothetical protein
MKQKLWDYGRCLVVVVVSWSMVIWWWVEALK